jgi:hypothetical protein
MSRMGMGSAKGFVASQISHLHSTDQFGAGMQSRHWGEWLDVEKRLLPRRPKTAVPE